MRRARQPAGYVLLAVLLLTALVASLVMTYSRHALLSAQTSSADAAEQRAQAAADTGFAWAKQSLRADAAAATTLDLGDGRSVAISSSGTGNLRSIDVDATTETTSQSLQATFEVYSVTGDALPELTAAAKALVPGHATTTVISGTRNYSSTEITGILYLRDGSHLTLQNVILDGAIVTEAAVTGSSGDVEIELLGGVQIRPGSVLPGCAIVAPNAEIEGNGSERVEIHGAIVAEEIDLPGTGAIHGAIASTDPPELGSGIDLPGAGRAPRAWPASLDTRASGVSRLSFTAADVREAEQNAIRAYTFPVRRLGAAEGQQPQRP